MNLKLHEKQKINLKRKGLCLMQMIPNAALEAGAAGDQLFSLVVRWFTAWRMI